MKNKVANQLFAGILAVTLVVAGPAAPLTSVQAAPTRTVTVTNEKQLRAALKNNKVTKITVKTSKNVTLTIPVGEYGNKQLVINAPKAAINNKGDFKAISIADARKYTEKGSANKITIRDKNTLTFVASEASSAAKVTVAAEGKKLVVTDNGEMRLLKVKAGTNLTIKGKAENTPVVVSADVASIHVAADADIRIADGVKVGTVYVDQPVQVGLSGKAKEPVAVVVNAQGAKIQAAAPVNVAANANAEINLAKGAEGSTVSASEGVNATVNNQTNDKVEITKPDGKTQTVAAGGSAKTLDDTKTDDKKDDKKDDKTDDKSSTTGGSTGGSGGGSTGGSSGGSTTPAKSDFAVTAATCNEAGTQLDVTMAQVTGVQFKLDGQTITGSYSDTKYTLNVAGLKGGVHTLTISKDGYNTKTLNVKYAPKPVIGLVPSEDTETVFQSDVAALTERRVEVTNYLANTAVIAREYYKGSTDGDKIASWDEVKAYLASTENATVVAKYVATYEDQTSDAKTVTYTVKADIAATKVDISGTGAVGEILTAKAGTDEGEAGGGITYQWKVSDSESGDYTDITGATDKTFVIGADQYNKYVKCAIKNKGEESEILSNARQITGKAQVTVSGITYTGNTKETAGANGAALEAAKLTGTATYDNTVVEGTWSLNDDTSLTASKTISVTFTPTNPAYAPQTGTVYIYVKAATPEKLALTTEVSDISAGKVKFTTAPANMQYKTGKNGVWTDVTTEEFAASVGDQIFFRTIETGTDGTDGYLAASDATEALVVAEENMGAKREQIEETLTKDNFDKWVTYDSDKKTATVKGTRVEGDKEYVLRTISGAERKGDPGEYGTLFSAKTVTSVELPNTVTSITNSAFDNCSILKTINIPDKVAEIGDGAFAYCSELENLTIPDSVTSIGHAAFMSCGALTDITIPDSVMTIGADAFDDCDALVKVVLPNKLTRIEDRTFNGCYELSTINIPDTVTVIGRAAFHACGELTDITIPASVTSIEAEALEIIGKVTIQYKGTTEQWKHICSEAVGLPALDEDEEIYAIVKCTDNTLIYNENYEWVLYEN